MESIYQWYVAHNTIVLNQHSAPTKDLLRYASFYYHSKDQIILENMKKRYIVYIFIEKSRYFYLYCVRLHVLWFCYFGGTPKTLIQSHLKATNIKYLTNISLKMDPCCTKSVHILRFSGPHFPAFGLNTEIYSKNLRIYFQFRNMRIRKTTNRPFPRSMM